MKQLIIPIAIIVALIAVFVIVDRKEFNRFDGVQNIQSEKQFATNRKSPISSPETKPATEVKYAVETRMLGTKSEGKKLVAEIKLAETKLEAETKSLDGTNLSEEARHEEKNTESPQNR